MTSHLEPYSRQVFLPVFVEDPLEVIVEQPKVPRQLNSNPNPVEVRRNISEILRPSGGCLDFNRLSSMVAPMLYMELDAYLFDDCVCGYAVYLAITRPNFKGVVIGPDRQCASDFLLRSRRILTNTNMPAFRYSKNEPSGESELIIGSSTIIADSIDGMSQRICGSRPQLILVVEPERCDREWLDGIARGFLAASWCSK